jgi:membrane protease YdiL (CAAX protease family)
VRAPRLFGRDGGRDRWLVTLIASAEACAAFVRSPQPASRAASRDQRIVGVYVALIASAEACVAFVSPVAGAATYAVVLTLLLTDAVLRQAPDNEPRTPAPRVPLVDALLALSFLPVLRLVSMSAPVGAGSDVGRLLLVAAIILTAIAWAVWGVRLPRVSPQPRVPSVESGVAWLVVPIAVGAYFAMRPAPLAEGDAWGDLAAAALAVTLAAVVEEVIFRGFIQTSFTRVYGAAAAPVFATAVYVIFYLSVRPGGMIAYAALLGLVLGRVVQRSHSLADAIVIHSVANVTLFVLLPRLAG